MGTKGYSEKELIMMLRKKAEELGRSPKIKDVKADGAMPPISAYYAVFGAWDEAQKAAKLFPTMLRHSKTELIYLLRKKAKELGETPTMMDFDVDPEVPSNSVFIGAFGSWNNAILAAGLPIKTTRRRARV